MKKIIYILSIVTLLLTSNQLDAKAKKAVDFNYFPRNEIYIQYGAPTILELGTLTGKTMVSPVGVGEKIEGKTSNYKFSGAVAAGYSFQITDRISIGLDFNYSYASADVTASIGPLSSKFNSAIMSYSGMINGHLMYYQESGLEISSGLYLGLNYRDEILSGSDVFKYEESDMYKFAYHLTAVKVRYGNVFGLIAELGFGYRGLVNVGLSVKF